MTTPVFDQQMVVKTTGRSKLALDLLVASLRASGRVKWKGKKVTQEAVVNAVWLWLEELGVDVVEAAMARQVPRLEAIMSGEPDPALTVKPGDPVDITHMVRVRTGGRGTEGRGEPGP